LSEIPKCPRKNPTMRLCGARRVGGFRGGLRTSKENRRSLHCAPPDFLLSTVALMKRVVVPSCCEVGNPGTLYREQKNISPKGP
jgi:hypothetical protein